MHCNDCLMVYLYARQRGVGGMTVSSGRFGEGRGGSAEHFLLLCLWLTRGQCGGRGERVRWGGLVMGREPILGRVGGVGERVGIRISGGHQQIEYCNQHLDTNIFSNSIFQTKKISSKQLALSPWPHSFSNLFKYFTKKCDQEPFSLEIRFPSKHFYDIV